MPPRMTTRRWMIAVAALALLIAPAFWLDRAVRRSLGELYGPGGRLARQTELARAVSTALDLVRVGRFAEAEAAFRGLGPLAERAQARSRREPGWWDAGLAAAIAGQGRHAEAEPLFRAALGDPGAAGPRAAAATAEELGWYAATLRALGRDAAAAGVAARAAAGRPGAATSPSP